MCDSQQFYCKPLGVHCTVAANAIDHLCKNYPNVGAAVRALDAWKRIQGKEDRLCVRSGGNFLVKNGTRKTVVQRFSIVFLEVLSFIACWRCQVPPLCMRVYNAHSEQAIDWDWSWFSTWDSSNDNHGVELWTRLVTGGGFLQGRVSTLLDVLAQSDRGGEIDCYRRNDVVVKYVLREWYVRQSKRGRV